EPTYAETDPEETHSVLDDHLPETDPYEDKPAGEETPPIELAPDAGDHHDVDADQDGSWGETPGLEWDFDREADFESLALEPLRAPIPAGDTLAVRRGNAIYIQGVLGGQTVRRFVFGHAGDEIFAGDFNGNGYTEFALRRGNQIFVQRHIGDLRPPAFTFGRLGDEVFIGDFNADGRDTFAIRRGNAFHIRNTLTSGPADRILHFGRAGDEVLVGAWDGQPGDTFAVRRGNTFFLRNDLLSGNAHHTFTFGRHTDDVLVGDWNGDGRDNKTVRRGNRFYVDTHGTGGNAGQIFAFGRADDHVLTGRFDHNLITHVPAPVNPEPFIRDMLNQWQAGRSCDSMTPQEQAALARVNYRHHNMGHQPPGVHAAAAAYYNLSRDTAAAMFVVSCADIPMNDWIAQARADITLNAGHHARGIWGWLLPSCRWWDPNVTCLWTTQGHPGTNEHLPTSAMSHVQWTDFRALPVGWNRWSGQPTWGHEPLIYRWPLPLIDAMIPASSFDFNQQALARAQARWTQPRQVTIADLATWLLENGFTTSQVNYTIGSLGTGFFRP
ncbi:MAG: hypothetical protein FWG11_04310, partial [Promicromonosporaceae bacterium]|nr:hypothetical protein [Promicromonosporaceae bacterium]